MKKIIFLSAVFWAVICSAALPMKKTPILTVHVEVEFDRAHMLVEGYLPNTCYSEPRAEIYPGKGIVMADVVASVSTGFCAEKVAPFEIKVDLGTFPEGRHFVVLQAGTRWERELSFDID